MSAHAFELVPGRPIEAQLLALLRTNARTACQAARRPGTSYHERLHDARLACKRLRAGLKLLGAAGRRYATKAELRVAEAARELGRVRDPRSILAAFDTLVRRHARDARRYQVLRRDLANRQPGAQEIREATRSFLREFETVRGSLSARSARRSNGFSFLAKGLQAAYRDARAAYRRAVGHARSADFHRMRRRAKGLGQDLRLVRSAWKPIVKGHQRSCDRINQVLGEDHDLVLLVKRFERGDIGSERRALVREVRRWAQADGRAARRAAWWEGKRLFELKPKRWVRLLANEWAVAESSG